MTQLDLPPISFARYLELLKRRRWQVIPMSALGLVVGAVVAFFIPRYYVAETTLVYTGTVLDKDSRTDSDPMFALVRGASMSIKATIPEALEKLQWVGTNPEDPARQRKIDEVDGRTTVTAYPVEKGRADYAVRIEYRDSAGQRAADFANTLRDIWTANLISQFNEQAALEMRAAQDEVTRQRRAGDENLLEISRYRQEHGIEPRETDVAQAENLLKNDLRTQQGIVTELAGQIESLKTELEQLQASIDEGFGSVRRKITKEVPIAGDTQLGPEIQKLIESISYHKQAADRLLPGTEWYTYHMDRYQAAQRLLMELVPQGSTAGMRRVEEDNPAYFARLQEINDKKARLSGLESQVAVHRNALKSIATELEKLPEIWFGYDRLLKRRAEITANWETANAKARELEAANDRARTGNAFTKVARALPPPAPTEPNVMLVAFAGSLLGLAAAIGLVLLLDILRSTFKTVDDVSYVLKLPVLGVMSHLETDAVRQATVKRRRVISLVIAVFVTLVLSIVTVYYIAPTRLPPFVLQALDAILRGGTAR